MPPPMPGAATGDPDPSAYDALAQAKELLRSVRAGALATLEPGNGFPFASLVNAATAPDGSPILLLSRLAAHTRHLASDPRLSLLLAQTGAGDPLAHPRVTIMGRAECVVGPVGRAALKARFLAKHPQSALYVDFADFSFWLVTMDEAHLNGGFARAGHFKAASLVTSLDSAEALVAAEPQALSKLNRPIESPSRNLRPRLRASPMGHGRQQESIPKASILAAAIKPPASRFPGRFVPWKNSAPYCRNSSRPRGGARVA